MSDRQKLASTLLPCYTVHEKVPFSADRHTTIFFLDDSCVITLTKTAFIRMSHNNKISEKKLPLLTKVGHWAK